MTIARPRVCPVQPYFFSLPCGLGRGPPRTSHSSSRARLGPSSTPQAPFSKKGETGSMSHIVTYVATLLMWPQAGCWFRI
jgi:hypothetical protein